MKLPILYSFRRCPYAMRARLSLKYASIELEHREIVFSNKPAEMLETSPKGTVPVLVLPNNDVIDESIDIMEWALTQNDPDNWGNNIKHELIIKNDTVFKPALDIYKYSDRYADNIVSTAFDTCLDFLKTLEKTENRSILTDMAILPFIRQFSKVDIEKFQSLDIPNTQKWLEKQINSDLFTSIMEKHPIWKH